MKTKIIKLYKSGSSLLEIALKLGLSKSKVYRTLKEAKTPLRTRGKAPVSDFERRLGLGRQERRSGDNRWKRYVPGTLEDGIKWVNQIREHRIKTEEVSND